MRNPLDRRAERGQSTVEVLIVAAILAIAAQATVLVLRQASLSLVGDRDRLYATDKALQMLEELRAEVLDEAAEVSLLDIYDDGLGAAPDYTPNFRYTLTTERSITHPGSVPAEDRLTATAPLSANPIRDAKGYAFVRNVRIERDARDENLRRIRVRVYLAADNPGNSLASTPLPKGGAGARPMAEVMGTVRSLGTTEQPAQVLDYFLVALENVPGWWSRTSNLIPLMQASIVSLQARNPGLKIRPHWIKRMSFGRDLEYTPEVNQAVNAATAGAFDKTYVYPGVINYSTGADEYYSVGWFNARINVDGALRANKGYPMADQYNHAMRLPDEERLYEIMSSIAANTGEPQPEMSLRQLLDRMNSNHASVRNAIVVNLHGEMLPVPPLRNVSDAAKDPAWARNRGGGLPARNWRVVSHFERLAYDTSIAAQQNQALRVYAYDMSPPAPNGAITQADEDDIIDEVTVFIPGADLTNLAGVERVRGNSRNPYKRHRFPTDLPWTINTDLVSGSVINYADGVTPTTWVADEYSPPGRDPGLRIRLLGVTPTARVYNGPAYSYYYAD